MERSSFSVEVPGGSLHGWVSGDAGPRVLLLHGGPGVSFGYVDGLAQEIGAGFQVAAYQQRGIEPSTLEGPFAVEREVADALAVLDALSWERAWVVGHSWGGHLLLHVAVAAPERLQGGLAIEPLGALADGGMEAFEAEMLRRTPADDRALAAELDERAMRGEGGPEAALESMRLFWPAYFASPDHVMPFDDMRVSVPAYAGLLESLATARPRLQSALAGLEIPLGFLAGARSPMPPDQAAGATARAIQTAWLEVVEDAGHFPWFERPGCVRAALQRLTGGGAVETGPDVAEVRRIAAIRDPVLRNLEITHCYWRLAGALARRTGAGANWCTFATWASRQAGSTIRGEDSVGLLRTLLGRRAELLHPIASLWRLLLRRGLLDPTTRLGRVVAELHTPFDAVERAGDAVSRGNKKVFEEIGLQFARYLNECPADAAVESREVQAFLDALAPGDPPDGQRYLRQAFLRYQRMEPDGKARAETLLAANLEIGLHEQTRLQPEIREALDAPYATKEDLGWRLLEVLLPQGTRARRVVPDRAGAAMSGWVGARIERAGEAVAREVITRSLLVLSLPGRVLWLGTHLPDPYPEALREIEDEELAALLAVYEPVAPAGDDCGARDWSVLEQRMHYIVHLFRSWHDQADLSQPPFTPAQLSSIGAGVIPDGDL